MRQKAKSHAAKLKKALAAIGCEASGGDEDRGDEERGDEERT